MHSRSTILVTCVLIGLMLAAPAGAKIVGWWKFDGTYDDSSGNGNHGTVVGAPTFEGGQYGQSLRLNATTTDQYVNCGTNTGFSTVGEGGTATGVTLSVWTNRPATSGDFKICGNLTESDWAAGHGFKWAIYNNLLEFDMRDSVGRFFSRDVAPAAVLPAFAANTWYHVAMVFDDKAHTLTEYVNGQAGRVWTSVPRSLRASTTMFRIGTDLPNHNTGVVYRGWLDDLRLYDTPLSVADITDAMNGLSPDAGGASTPQPADKATDVVRDITLVWKVGKYAATHNVYFGTAFDDVNNATVANPTGVLVAQQDANTYDPAGVLQYGQTYYWRVDEVNAPPTASTIFRGTTWSFTVEPVAYALPTKSITATASGSYTALCGPEKTVDGSGLNAADQHGVNNKDMWISGKTGPHWIQYQFDGLYKLQEMWVWNSNQSVEPALGFGVKTATIEYSADGVNWTALSNVPEFAQAPGLDDYAHDTTVLFGGVAAQYVKITPTSNWGGLGQYSLSEVRFYHIPVQAREPKPATGATAIDPGVTLSWRAGREAASHQVYLGTDPNALTLAGTTTVNSYTPTNVGFDATYYWKVVEVNNTEALSTWSGSVWSFTTASYSVVDDMESYNDKEGTSIWNIWIDGYNTSTNGAQVGYGTSANSTFCETTIVNGGRQSMPFIYTNTNGITNAEAVRTFTDTRDWTLYGIKGLSLAFCGDPTNSSVQLYVKINGTKVVYSGKADDIKQTQWLPFIVDLSKVPASVLKSVTKLTIGVDGAGSGRLLIDDIRLYPSAGELVTPANPGTTGLLAWYKLEGDFKDSAGTFNGTAVGNAKVTSDTLRGQVLALDGTDDAVSVPKLAENGTSLSISMWANTSAASLTTVQYASLFHTAWVAGGVHFRYGYGKIQSGFYGATDLTGVSIIQPNQWYHVAITVAPTGYALWLNGLKEASLTYATPISALIGNGYIGAWLNGTAVDREFTGMIDDVRFYNRTLSQAELGWLAGRTDPFVRPF